MSESTLPAELGIFYPRWIVSAFPKRELAEQVRTDLFAGGYDEEDCKLVTAEQVVPSAEGQLESAGWLARLGKRDEMVQCTWTRLSKEAFFWSYSRLRTKRRNV